MMAQRMVQQSLRRLKLQSSSPSAISRASATTIGLPAARSLLSAQQKRVASTTSQEQLSVDQGYDILVKQRLNRPVAPHLGIYRPQITWYSSGFNRITGSVLSGAFYIFGFGYLIQPLLGYHIFESSSVIAAFASMSPFLKVPIKFTAAFFFAFHTFQGFRHLTWDTGKMINNVKVIQTGWAAVGLSVALSAWFAFM